jgi:hypothetical protein
MNTDMDNVTEVDMVMDMRTDIHTGHGQDDLNLGIKCQFGLALLQAGELSLSDI